jgi:hypothetical protein
MRTSVAHSGELHGQIDEHASKAPHIGDGFVIGVGSYVKDCFDGRNFMNSFEGRILSYELSQSSLDGLSKIVATFFSAFRDAERELGMRASAGPSKPTTPA